jgi:hypothetical protein
VTRLKWKLISVPLETVLVSVQDRCTVCAKCTSLRNRFGRTGWYSLVRRLEWKLVSVRLDTVLILIQDRYTVCTERTLSSEIILDAPDGTPR